MANDEKNISIEQLSHRIDTLEIEIVDLQDNDFTDLDTRVCHIESVDVHDMNDKLTDVIDDCEESHSNTSALEERLEEKIEEQEDKILELTTSIFQLNLLVEKLTKNMEYKIY